MNQLSKIEDMRILKEAIRMRVKSRRETSFAGKIISALRNQFGGHKIN